MVPAVAALLVKALELHASTLEHYVICFKASVRLVLLLSFYLHSMTRLNRLWGRKVESVPVTDLKEQKIFNVANLNRMESSQIPSNFDTGLFMYPHFQQCFIPQQKSMKYQTRLLNRIVIVPWMECNKNKPLSIILSNKRATPHSIIFNVLISHYENEPLFLYPKCSGQHVSKENWYCFSYHI